MATNIYSTIVILNKKARIAAKDVLILKRQEKEFPECNFLKDLIKKAEAVLCETKVCTDCNSRNENDALFCKRCGIKLNKDLIKSTDIFIKTFDWSGEGSGYAEEFLIKEVAPKIMGELHVIFQWEGGFEPSGLAIKDGKVIQPKVIRTLKIPADW